MSQRFVGRQRDLEGVCQLIADGARLVTIRGAPGMGKSRLAAEVLRTSGDLFEDRIIVCDLEAASEAAGATRLLLATLPRSSEAAASGGDPAIAALRSVSRAGRALVVLDNADDLESCAAETVGSWHELAPNVCFLVTSRARLRIAAEVSRELEPLSLADSVALFCDRVAQYRDLPTEAATDATLVEIAELLDGIPLALELAAARTTVLSLTTLRDRLAENLDLLTSRDPDRPERHHRLRSAVEWSCDNLDPAHRSALAELSVFRGGFELEQAEAIVDAGSRACLDLLQELVDRSLVGTYIEEKRVRYRLYRPIRAVAAEHLLAAGRTEETERRHAAYFADFAQRMDELYQSPEATSALSALDSAFDDIQAVHLRLRGSDPALSARVALVLLQTIRARGLHRRYLEMFDDAVTCATGCDDDELSARAHFARGLALLGSHRGRARDDFDRARVLATGAGNDELRADALIGLGAVSFADHDHWRQAEECWLEALELYEGSGHLMGLANANANLAVAALDAGDLERAQRYATEATSIYEREGLQHRLAFPVLISAAIAQELGDLDRARELCSEARQLARDLHQHRGHEAEALVQLASVECEQGRFAMARALCIQAIDVYRAIESFDAIASALVLGAVASALDGDLDAATELLEQARPHLGAYRARDGRALYQLGAAVVGHCDRAAPAPTEATEPVELGQLARSVRRLLHARAPSTKAPTRRRLRIGPSARWFQVDGKAPVSLGRRMLLRRMVEHFARQSLRAPGQPSTAQELLAVGWPDEVIDSAAATNRLYVAIAKLRRVGLAGVLITRFEGYLFDPETEVVLETVDDPSG